MNELVKKFFAKIGIETPSMKDGKVDVSAEQKQNLVEAFGEQTVEKVFSYLEKEAELLAAKQKNTTNEEIIAALKKRNEELELSNSILQNEPEADKPIEIVANEPTMHVVGDNKKYAFGVAHPAYSKEKWYNKLSAGSKAVEKRSKGEVKQFLTEFETFGAELGKRYSYLQENGLFTAVAAGDIDYTNLSNAVGDYYYTRRQDALITYIRKFPDVSSIFPLQYGVQDGQVLVDAFQSKSFTQAYQAGEIFAGSWEISPNIASVHDVMFKFLFKDLKDLETQYIGYLNREGSNPIKWTFIEWVVARASEIILNEKNQRRVAGIRIEPTAGKASHYMYASNGVLTSLEKFKNEHRVYIMADKNIYTNSTILDYFSAMADEVRIMVGTGSLQGWALYFNANHIKMYLDAYKDAYGTHANFDGAKLEIVHEDGLKMIGVPNMGKRYDVWITPEQNFELYEMEAGEPYSMYFEQRLEQLFAVSWFKEGTGAMKIGRAYASDADVLAAEGKLTTIFANKPFSSLLADATSADATTNRYFRTIANTGATSFIDFAGAVQGVVYKLEIGSLTNATKVAQAAKFANITADFTPVAVGDSLSVIYDPIADEFLEVERVVNGVRTVNAALKAPEYVEAI